MKTTEEVSRTLVKQMRDRAKHPAQVWGLSWGFAGLDNLTGGIHMGELSVLMARPGVGKSFFMGQVALTIAEALQETGTAKAVKLVLCEMTAEQFQQRLICARAGVSPRAVRSGYLTPAQRKLYEGVAEEVCALPIEYLDDSQGFKDSAAFIKGREGLPPAWFAVDYIGIHPAGNSYLDGDDYKRVSYLSAGFRDLAKYSAPGLVLVQMNRNVESSSRTNKRPMLSDIRDSGKLEHDISGVAMGLFRPDLYLDTPDEEKHRPKPAELTVIKHRNGPLGKVELLWCPEIPGFCDISGVVDDVAGMTPQPPEADEAEGIESEAA